MQSTSRDVDLRAAAAMFKNPVPAHAARRNTVRVRHPRHRLVHSLICRPQACRQCRKRKLVIPSFLSSHRTANFVPATSSRNGEPVRRCRCYESMLRSATATRSGRVRHVCARTRTCASMLPLAMIYLTSQTAHTATVRVLAQRLTPEYLGLSVTQSQRGRHHPQTMQTQCRSWKIELVSKHRSGVVYWLFMRGD